MPRNAFVLSDDDPQDVGTADPGTSREVSRADHAHGGGAGVSFSDAEGDPAPLGTAVDGTSVYAARRDHVHAHGTIASGDLHTEYQKESEKGAANGYASLDSGGKVPTAQLPTVGHTIKDEGTALAQRANLDFLGSAVQASDDSGGGRTIVRVYYSEPVIYDEGSGPEILFEDGDIVTELIA